MIMFQCLSINNRSNQSQPNNIEKYSFLFILNTTPLIELFLERNDNNCFYIYYNNTSNTPVSMEFSLPPYNCMQRMFIFYSCFFNKHKVLFIVYTLLLLPTASKEE